LRQFINNLNRLEYLKLNKYLFNRYFIVLSLFLALFLIDSCSDSLGLDPNIKSTLLKEQGNIVRDTIYLVPGASNDSLYVIIIRYQKEKDSLQKVVDSIRNFQYPNLNPKIVKVDSFKVEENIFFINSLGLEQREKLNWHFKRKNLEIRLDTLNNWPVFSTKINFLNDTTNINSQINNFENREFSISSLKLNTNKINILHNAELTTDISLSNNFELNIKESNGDIIKNPNYINKFRVWFSEMNINRLTKDQITHSFVFNFEATISGLKSKTVFKGSCYISYY